MGASKNENEKSKQPSDRLVEDLFEREDFLQDFSEFEKDLESREKAWAQEDATAIVTAQNLRVRG